MAEERNDLIWGLNVVLAALQQHPERVDAVWLSEERVDRRGARVIEAAHQAGIKLRRVPRARLDQLTGAEHHQGAVARLHAVPARREQSLESFLGELTAAPLLLVLDGVQDPHNLGACLRCADAAGVNAVILPRDRAASITGSVRHVASGAADSLSVFQVTNLARTLGQLKDAGIWLVGATQDAQTELFEADLRGALALVVGGEGKGLRRLTRECCDLLLRIPMLGSVPSLNVSVAAAVCLYESVRQRQSSPALRSS
jgi:23S rRNA (guanosine2251-2'-O)-methyltransferase